MNQMKNKQLNTYRYCGPVVEYDRCIAFNWRSETSASTEKRARSNLAYQFRKQTNRAQNVRIQLPGKLEIVK